MRVPSHGRLLGLDFGTKRVGVAVSDVEQRYAAAVTVINRSSAKGDADALLRIGDEHHVVGLVVGLPVHKSGDEGAKAKQAREFGTWAGRAMNLPVVYWDERHSSTIAEGYLISGGASEKRRKATLDAIAAQIMLQSYLDAPDRTVWTAQRKQNAPSTHSTPESGPPLPRERGQG
ncbi:MAG: Holliday junction resolvase RuvX [Planctomycetaceae bacterium]|nr:Holliday junction resolvase RuvX [Planctomycetaceae bacterium]